MKSSVITFVNYRLITNVTKRKLTIKFTVVNHVKNTFFNQFLLYVINIKILIINILYTLKNSYTYFVKFAIETCLQY